VGAWGKTHNVSRTRRGASGGSVKLSGFAGGRIWQQCHTRPWAKARVTGLGTRWGVPVGHAEARADHADFFLQLKQRRDWTMPKGKTEGKWWVDDIWFFEQPKVTVRFDKLLEPHMKKDNIFVFTRPVNAELGRYNYQKKKPGWCSYPYPREELKAFDTYGLRGQRVSLFFGIYSRVPLDRLRVQVKGGALTGPDGAKILCDEVEYAPGFLGPEPSHLLRKHDKAVSFDDAPRMPYFLAGFPVPRDAAPGSYKGDIVISIGGRPYRTVPVKLRVQNLELPVLRDIYVGMIFQGSHTWYYEALPLYSRCGFSSMTKFGRFFSYTKGKDGQWHIDLEHLGRKLKMLKANGITAGVCPFSDLDLGPLWANGALGGGRLPKKVKTNEGYQREIKRLEAFQKAHPELPRIIYMTWDEPGYGKHGQPCDKMGWVNEVAPNALTTLDASYEVFPRILQYYTMPTFDDPANKVGPEVYQYLRKKGKKYGFAAGQGLGEQQRYQTGMMMIASGATYMHVWHLNNRRACPLMAKVSRNGPMGRSISIAGAGEGMTDLKMYRLLKDAMAEAEKSDDQEVKRALKQANRYLEKLFAVWDADHRHQSGYPYLGLAHEWGYDQFYQDWRRRMATLAAELKDVEWIE
jgi:hypothetical protein